MKHLNKIKRTGFKEGDTFFVATAVVVFVTLVVVDGVAGTAEKEALVSFKERFAVVLGS